MKSAASTPYHVRLAARAAHDLEALYLEKNAQDSLAATRWFNGLEESIFALKSHPQRCSMVPEANLMKQRLRQLLYGKKHNVYRIVFRIDEAQQDVWVLTIRHGARRKLRTSDLT